MKWIKQIIVAISMLLIFGIFAFLGGILCGIAHFLVTITTWWETYKANSGSKGWE